jgi:starch phosphorylase
MRSPKSSLTRIAHNLRWAWHPEVRKVFYEVDPERYVSLRRNPVALLADVADVPPGAVERADELVRDLDSHLESRNTWADAHAHLPRSRPVAYFSMEYGIHESLPIYAGGLGVLAADHLKSASDLGIPLVAVGMLYREGYFDQTLDEEGWQRESYPRVEPERLPLRPASTPQGEPIRVQVHTRGGPIHAAVWEAAVGRVRLFLLDTDVEDNDEADRALTVRLYAGDTRTRIRQELLLGVGGLRALVAAGIEPGVLHMNEGHSAFAALELTRMRMRDEDLGFAQAAARVTDQSVFTTHTPVPAGHDRFPPDLVEEHLGPLRERLGLDQDGLMGLGRVHAEDEHETFCMTVLAMKMAHRRNGVSNLHGRVSRRMWQGLWPARAEHDVPIGHVTNGVHVPTWMAPEMRALLDKHLDDDWLERQAEPKTWAPIEDIEDDVLWNTHRRLKRKLIEFARRTRSSAPSSGRSTTTRCSSVSRGASRRTSVRRWRSGTSSTSTGWSTPPTGRFASCSRARRTPATTGASGSCSTSTASAGSRSSSGRSSSSRATTSRWAVT